MRSNFIAGILGVTIGASAFAGAQAATARAHTNSPPAALGHALADIGLRARYTDVPTNQRLTRQGESAQLTLFAGSGESLKVTPGSRNTTFGGHR